MFNRTMQQNTTLLQPLYLVLSLPSGITVTTDKNPTVVWLQQTRIQGRTQENHQII